jgi:hypothetical protein
MGREMEDGEGGGRWGGDGRLEERWKMGMEVEDGEVMEDGQRDGRWGGKCDQ